MDPTQGSFETWVNLSSDRPCEPNPLSSAQSIIERHAQSMAEDESVDMNAFEESALSHNTLCWEDEEEKQE